MPIFKKIFSIFLRIATSITLLVFLFKFNKIDVPSLVDNIRHADKYFIALAFFISCLTYILCLLRWQMLLKVADIHLPLKRVITSFSGGVFFSLFLPSSIGGDFVRIVDLGAHTKKLKKVLATVLLDRLSGYVGLVLLVFISLPFGWKLIEDKAVLTFIIAISGVLISILLVLFNNFLFSKVNRLLGSSRMGKIGESMSSLHEEMHIFRYHKKVIFNNLILSILIQAVSPVAFYLTAISLGIDKNIIYFFVFLPIIGAITLLPISIGGLGVRENMTVFFFNKIGISQHVALAISLFNFSFILLYGAIGGLIYVLTLRHRRVQPNKPSSVSALPEEEA